VKNTAGEDFENRFIGEHFATVVNLVVYTIQCPSFKNMGVEAEISGGNFKLSPMISYKLK
jgi:hypothetical protein